ncbi:transposon Tf2-9 polyprotein [Trichonephila clavipes]|nr:transposon Tf2-9 polyprotein [Trichonephila clavipes]
MPVFSAAFDRGTLRPSTALRITVLNPSIPCSANSQSDLKGREQQYCNTIIRNPGTHNSTFVKGPWNSKLQTLLRQNQDLIRALQIRDDSHSHKVTVQFDKFDEENENLDSFIERFETYLNVQNVPIANRAKVFVSSLSAKLYQLLKNLLAPDIPSDQTLDKLKDALKKHLTPKPLIIPSRHKFLNRKQTEGEGISTYIAELRALAMNCDYDKDMLNIMLRNVFVSGLRDKMILDRLFEEDNINLEKTLNIALAMEKLLKGQMILWAEQ